jgi:hypothetical protein
MRRKKAAKEELKTRRNFETEIGRKHIVTILTIQWVNE